MSAPTSKWTGRTEAELAAISKRNRAARKPEPINYLGATKKQNGEWVKDKPKKPPTRARVARGSVGEELLAMALHLTDDVGGWQREYKFHPSRRWRVDFAWPSWKLAVEIEGGIWTNGRHTRGKGFENDCLKYNALALAGWKLLRFTPQMVKSGRAVLQIQLALES